MHRLATLLLSSLLFLPTLLQADGGFCRKCEVLREYHKNNPSKYEFYDDYLKDLEEKGAEDVNPSVEDLPPDVRFIMNPDKSVSDNEKE